MLDALNTQECWDLFTDKVYYAIEKFIPINDKNKSTSKDWVNSKVRYEIKNKKQAWSKLWKKIKSYITHCIQNNNYILENEWIMARKLFTKISDVARSQYESRIIINCKNNPKTFWSYVEKNESARRCIHIGG